MNKTITYCLEILFMLSICSSSKQCSEKLLENKTKVPDSAFSESTYKDNYRAKWARESTSNEMAWCPKNEIYSLKQEFLQIDLGGIYVLKMLMTKGLSRHGFITASSYIIEYKREQQSEWIEYRESGLEKRIQGNKDHLTEKYDSLDPHIIARWIKIYPLAEKSVKICLVIQLYGCIYTNNILEYKMVDGDQQHNLSDYNYDGYISNYYLSNGLGKLMTLADSDIDNPLKLGKENLVGWSRQTTPYTNVTIIFRFNLVRNFSSFKIETSNYFSENVKTFSKMQIAFSIDGYVYDRSQDINSVVPEDTINPKMRFISTNLLNRIGKFVKVDLAFRSEWIIIRRVEFNSVVSANYLPAKPQSTEDMIHITQIPIIPFAEKDFFSIPLAYTLVIVISILIIMLLIGIPCVTIFIRRQKYRNKKCKEALQRHFQEEQARFLTLSQQHFKDSIRNPGLFTVSQSFQPNLSSMTNRMIQEPSIYTSLAGSDTESNCASDKQQYGLPNLHMLTTCPVVNPINNNTNQFNDYSAPSFMTLGSNAASYIPYYSQNAQLTRSQVNLRSQYDVPILASQETYPKEISQSKSMQMYRPIQVSIQGPVGNSRLLSSITPPDILSVSSLNQLKLTSGSAEAELGNIAYIRTIGHGSYGWVHIAEVTTEHDAKFQPDRKFVYNEYNSLRESLTSSIDTENVPNSTQEKKLVSVKVLSKDAPMKIKREFYQEIKYLMTLNHKNFISIQNLEETPLGDCMVVSDYSSLQDVFNYIQCLNVSDSIHPSNKNTDVGANIISQSNLLYIASQVANAMKHLEMLQLVHCDLACRNILIMNEQLHIKISDLAMSQEKFSKDYVSIDNSMSSQKSGSCLLQNQSNIPNYCQGSRDIPTSCLLPIRWMAWQSLIKGVFSTKSDVYSFGVTLWELLTMCQKQPYQELTNEQVLINSNLQAYGDSRARVLSLPNSFSKELIDFITQCTSVDENKRPSFVEIDMFLQHKTGGFQLC